MVEKEKDLQFLHGVYLESQTFQEGRPQIMQCCNMLGLPGGFAVSRNEFARRVTYVKIMYVHPQPFSRRKFHGIFSVFHWFHISICKMFA